MKILIFIAVELIFGFVSLGCARKPLGNLIVFIMFNLLFFIFWGAAKF